MMVESILEILTKTRSQIFYEPIDPNCATNVVGKSLSSIRM